MFAIAFKHKNAEKTITHSLMSVVLNADFIHCEIIFSDGKIGSASQWLGVGIYSDNEDRNEFWQYYELPYYLETETRKYIIRKSGLTYNWAGIWGQMVFNVLPVSSKGFGCSDLCFVALKNAGLPLPNHSPETISPNDLRILIKNLGLKQIQYVK